MRLLVTLFILNWYKVTALQAFIELAGTQQARLILEGGRFVTG